MGTDYKAFAGFGFIADPPSMRGAAIEVPSCKCVKPDDKNFCSTCGVKKNTHTEYVDDIEGDFLSHLMESDLNTSSPYTFIHDMMDENASYYVGWFKTSDIRGDPVNYVALTGIPSKDRIFDTVSALLGEYAYLIEYGSFGFYSGVEKS